MNHSDTKIAAGLVGALALCCLGPLLVTLALPLLAAVTGQVVLIALATAVAVVAIGARIWRRRRGACGQQAYPTKPPVRAEQHIG